MEIYRAMSNEEADQMISSGKLSFRSRFKWFGTFDFVMSRVKDGLFNNSRFIEDRYQRLFKFTFDDKSMNSFNKCGNREFMLDRRKLPLVNYKFEEII